MRAGLVWGGAASALLFVVPIVLFGGLIAGDWIVQVPEAAGDIVFWGLIFGGMVVVAGAIFGIQQGLLIGLIDSAVVLGGRAIWRGLRPPASLPGDDGSRQ